jgi:peroxiredoxin
MEKKSPEYPAVGTRAPEFAAVVVGGGYEGGEEVTLGMLAGRVVVLYFYPKDDTPGCTVQACGLRDAWEEVRAKALVFGVSVDSVASHEKFIGKHGLPFPLLSDPDHAVAEAYGVWVEKSGSQGDWGLGRARGMMRRVSRSGVKPRLMRLMECERTPTTMMGVFLGMLRRLSWPMALT